MQILTGVQETQTMKILKPNNYSDLLWSYIGACTARGAAADRTRQAYGAAISRFIEWCSGRQLDPKAARREDIEDWRGEMLAEGARANTVMLRLSAVRTLYRAMSRAGLRADNPAEYVKSPRPETAAPDAVMRKLVFPDQMVAALGKMGTDYRALRDRAILLTLYLLGLRVSEVAGLDWADWDDNTLAFRAKGGQTRELGVPEALKTALATLKAASTLPGPMFIGEGTRLTVRAIQAMVGTRLAAGGMGGRSPHALRHSCATAAAIAGSSSYAIQDQLGHASQRTTAIYTRVAGRFLEAPSMAVARAMGI
jgi:site-specific recombinase XerD